MSDDMKMPFGLHKGEFMSGVPANYLKHVYDQDWIDKWPTVKKYIDDNMQGILKQIEDGHGEV